VKVQGPGVAGVPGSQERMNELGAWWCYSWSRASRDYCAPMYRSSDYWADVSLEERMSTGMDSLLVLNEPYGQDRVPYREQPSMIKDIVERARIISPTVQCVIGNWSNPNLNIFKQHFLPTWEEKFPDEPFSEWCHSNEIWIGVHHYVWSNTVFRKYDKSKWRDTFGDWWLFCRDDLHAHGLAVTEWGCLDDGALWKQVLEDQGDFICDMDMARNFGTANAVFLWGREEDEGVSMGEGNGPRTDYGRHYARHVGR